MDERRWRKKHQITKSHPSFCIEQSTLLGDKRSKNLTRQKKIDFGTRGGNVWYDLRTQCKHDIKLVSET